MNKYLSGMKCTITQVLKGIYSYLVRYCLVEAGCVTEVCLS